MTDYLNDSFDFSSPELVSVFDEIPLWSSYFGAVLLDNIKFKKSSVILDIGCGTGFPLIEIAQRSGSGSKVYGIDPWSAALDRLRMKLRVMNIHNIEVIEGEAENLPFDDYSVDLIVSNNGINNVADPEKVMKESFRVLKKEGQLIFTVNLPETMKEFYDVFRECLAEYNLANEIVLLKDHIISKRKTNEMNTNMITKAGFRIEKIVNDEFRMKFIDGSAMFNYYFIKFAFLDSWKKIVPEELHYKFFHSVELKLNQLAEVKGEVSLTIPFVCYSCRK